MNTPLNTVTPVNYYSIPLPMSFNTMVVPSSNKYMVQYAITVGIFILTVTIWFTNNSLIQFICSSLVSLPLCGYLGFFLDQVVDISTSTRQPGQAALILYSCGNLPEIILSVSALYHEKYQIARESNVGSILSNLILVTGCVYYTLYTLYSQWIRNYSQYPMATVQSRTVNVSHNPMSLSLNGEGSTSTDRISEPELEIKTNYIIGLLTFPLGCYWLITNLNDLLSCVYYVYGENESTYVCGTGFSLAYMDKFYLITAGHLVDGEWGVHKNLGFRANFTDKWIYPKLIAYNNDYNHRDDYAIFLADIKSGLKVDDEDNRPAYIIGNEKFNIIKNYYENNIIGESGSPIVDIEGEVIGMSTTDTYNYFTDISTIKLEINNYLKP